MASKSSSGYGGNTANRALKLGMYIAGSAGLLIAGYKLGENRGFKTSYSVSQTEEKVGYSVGEARENVGYSVGEAIEDEKRSQPDKGPIKQTGNSAHDDGIIEGLVM